MRKLQKLNICTVFTAHLTQNIGGYGPSEVVSGGGTILGYAPSVEVRFSASNVDSITEKSAKGASMQKIRADIVKSRLGTKGKRVKFDLDFQYGLDPYAGIFDILRDYQFIIPASADVVNQIKEHTIPKKSSGWWMFKPWIGSGKQDDELTPQLCVDLYNKTIKEGMASEEGKFREGQLTKFCKDYDWMLLSIQTLLESIYPTEEIETGSIESSDNEDEEPMAYTPTEESLDQESSS